MAHYGAPTPKRHYAFGNTSMVLALDRGVLRKWKPSPGQKVVTAERYVDKSGKRRYKGTGKLRATENLGSSKLKPYSSLIFSRGWNNIPQNLHWIISSMLHQGARLVKGNIPFQWVYRYMKTKQNLIISESNWFHILPRHYPMAFARAVADVLEPMKRSAKGCSSASRGVTPGSFYHHPNGVCARATVGA